MKIIIVLILIIQSILDYKTNFINGYLNILLLLIGFFNCLINNYELIDKLLATSIIPLVLLILSKIKPNSLGEGDIECLSALGLVFGYKKIVYILFISCLLLLLYTLINKKNKYPFIPFITLSTIINILI